MSALISGQEVAENSTGHRPDSGQCLRIFVGDRLVSSAGIDGRHGAALAPAR